MTQASESKQEQTRVATVALDPDVLRAFETLPTATALLTLRGTIVWGNRVFVQLFGPERERLVGLGVAEFAPDGQLDPSSSPMRELAAGARARVAVAARCRSCVGDRVDVHVDVSLLPAATADSADCFLAVFAENHDGRVASLALERALSLQQAMFDAAGDGFLVTDVEENAVTCNGQFLAMWRLDPLELTSWDRVLRMPALLAQFADPAGFLRDLDELLETPDSASFRALELADGRVFELHGTPRFLEGKTVGRVFAFRDITGRVKAERALRHSQEQLVQAQKMEAVGRLAGGVAHDFNNLLTIISSYVHLIRTRRRNGPGLDEALAEIEKASDGAAELTRQLLAFSRKQILEPKVLDLNHLVTELSRMLRRVLGDDIELEISLARGIGRVRADRNQLEQVLLNLVVNARDAMTDGGRLVVATNDRFVVPGVDGAPLEALQGMHVVLTVTDTGVGMDEATRLRVFEPFFTTKDAGRGTGLGLATVYGMVRQSGGFVTVESEPGRGTRFDIGLPHVDEELDRSSSPPEEVVSDGTETVLLVEDSVAVRKLARTILESRGYDVVCAHDPLDALRLFEADAGRFHLVLCDVMMPKMDGRRLVESMRRVRADMKVLFMSGFTDTASGSPSSPPEFVRAGFIAKPFTPDRLALKVRRVLDGG